ARIQGTSSSRRVPGMAIGRTTRGRRDGLTYRLILYRRINEVCMSVDAAPRSQYVDFWNTILVPKFVRWRHILVDGLTLHSAKVFPSLAVNTGDQVVDAGCGFGDTAIQLAKLVGPSGSVLAIDCCDGFLEYGRKDAKAAEITNVKFLEADVQSYRFDPVHDFC